MTMTPLTHPTSPGSTALALATALATALCAATAALPCAAQPPAAARTARATAPAAVDDSPLAARRPDMLAFAADVAARHGLDIDSVGHALLDARYQPSVARLIMPAAPGSAKNWAAYRARFIDDHRIRAGSAFWRANRDWLALAESRYGVPAQIIIGVLGVETVFGEQTGHFRVIDALGTLAFAFPTGRSDRSAFFRDELEAFFVMCQAQGVDPTVPTGSYAGAMGLPQFMPSSVNAYAVDFDGDGRIDLSGSAADAIGSIAHYLAEFGWQRGVPARLAVQAPDDAQERALLLEPDITPSFDAADFVRHGAHLVDAPPGSESLRLALVALANGDAAPSYVAGTVNFYAITRYNHSSYYALAVIELGEAIQRALDADSPP